MRRGFSQFMRELKIETFSGRRQLQPDKTSWFVRYCACSCSPPCRRGPVNLRSGPILAVLIHSLKRLPLKLGLIQTLRSLCSLGPDFGRNADWLLEQCHKIWLAVESTEVESAYSSRGCFREWLVCSEIIYISFEKFRDLFLQDF